MMWNWLYRANPPMQGQYALKLPGVMNVVTTTDEAGMDRVYKLLGLRSQKSPTGQNVRGALQTSPVIVTSIEATGGHARVVSGYVGGRYSVVDPCADFTNNKCTAGDLQLPQLDIDGKLGTFIWFW